MSSSKSAVKQNKTTGARPNNKSTSPATITSNTSNSSSSSNKIINTKCVSGAPSKYVLAERFRTQLCRHYVEKGQCPYADRCMFAHGAHELRTYEENMQDGLFTEEAIKGWRRAMRLVLRERQQGGGGVPTSTTQPQQQQAMPQHPQDAEVPLGQPYPPPQPHSYNPQDTALMPQPQYHQYEPHHFPQAYSDTTAPYYYPQQPQQPFPPYQQYASSAPYYYYSHYSSNDNNSSNNSNNYINEGVADYHYSAPILSPCCVHHCNTSSCGDYTCGNCCHHHNNTTLPSSSDMIMERSTSCTSASTSLGQTSVDVCVSVSEGLVRGDNINNTTVAAGTMTHNPYAHTH